MSSTAEEMLSSLTEEEIAAYTANPEERHIIVDETRKITVPDELKRIAVQYDHNIETVTFDCIRYWDGHDMSTMHVYINYMLANKALGCYMSDDVTVDPDNESIIHFTWTISRNVTQAIGPITFLICIKRVDEEGNEVNHWNSELNKEMFVNQGLECGEPITEDYPDIIEQILLKLESQDKYPAWRRWTDASGNYTDESGMPYGVKLMDESNNASGSWSIAGGYNTTASGVSSASLGNSTTASGVGSVAFGLYSSASGDSSVAFGNYTQAIGHRSVAFGENTKAIVDNQLVVGRYNTPDSDAEGAIKHAFIIGNGTGLNSSNNKYNTSNAFTVDWNGNVEIAKSISSLNMGCSVSGGGLIALGGGNTASGAYSVAIGAGCRATGQDSLAFGGGSTASGICSVAFGTGNNTASNSYSISIGTGNTASATYSVAIGSSNTANGPYSVDIGYNCHSYTDFGVAIGANCTVGNENNTASGMYSVAIGAGCRAQSSYSMTFGASCTVSGDYSFAGGASNNVSGSYSVAMGELNRASGKNSVSIGKGLIAVGDNQTALGRYNVDETEFDMRNLFVLGNGTDTDHRSNAMEVDVAGNLNMNRDVVANAFGGSPISLVELSNRIGVVEEKPIFSGLTASFYGDSLTEENYHYTKGYHQWIKELLGLVSYNNYGVSGYKISDVCSKVDSINDTADIIFIMCGVNDENFSTPLGSFGDSTSGTIYGAYDALCRTLKEKYPTKMIVFITPHYQNKYPHNSGITSYEVSKAMKQVCEKYSIPVYDNFVLSGIGERNLSYWTTDNCHWNDKAHEMLGRNLSQFMKNTFGYYYGYNSGSGDEKPVLSVINQSISSSSYDTENQILSLSGLNQTFGGVVFNDATSAEIDVQTNLVINPDFLSVSDKGTCLGWFLVRVVNGYKGVGFDFGDGLLETYDVAYDLTSWNNRFTKDCVFDSSKNKLTVKIENMIANFYLDNDLVYSIENAAALGYAMSGHKTGTIYGMKLLND